MARVAALVLLVAFAFSAYCATAPAGTFTFRPAADTYVDQAHPSRNHGGAMRTWARGGADSRRWALARFNVSGISGTVTRATLHLYVSNATHNGPAVYETAPSWSEKRVSWKRRPSPAPGPRNDKGALSQNRWVSWDVTPWVVANGRYSFALKQGGPDAIGFKSRETGKAPTLVIKTAGGPSPPPPPPGSAEPGPIAGQGYHEVFRDDFNTLNRQVWDDHIWYDEAPLPAWTGYQAAENGVLHLRTSRSWFWGTGANDNWPINTVTTHTSGRTFKYGYFEARIKWTKGAGAWPGFWLISDNWSDVWPPQCSAGPWAGELDIFEGQGMEPGVFYGTVHKDSSNQCFADDQNSNNYQPTGIDLTAGFHTYGMLWEQGSVSWYLDDTLLMTSDAYYSTLDQPMMLLLQMWVGGWTSDPTSTTPSTLETQVDYVSVRQK
jgi:glycosyl hydrolase family 16